MGQQLLACGQVNTIHVWELDLGGMDANMTFDAPACLHILTISLAVVPLTMESSTSMTDLPFMYDLIGLSLSCNDFLRASWPGMMKVRPTYLFFTKASR